MAKQTKDLIDKSFSDMTYEEKITFLQKVRRSRRTPKATSKVVKSKKRQVKKTTDKLDALWDSMSDSEKKAFMEDLTK